jgi:hypothetical protein
MILIGFCSARWFEGRSSRAQVGPYAVDVVGYIVPG